MLILLLSHVLNFPVAEDLVDAELNDLYSEISKLPLGAFRYKKITNQSSQIISLKCLFVGVVLSCSYLNKIRSPNSWVIHKLSA